jgi:glycosyltransferase involved in cell wall biosynthesis
MKIAVYTIALNEEEFVERWYESVKDADYILIADTGSTDRTVEIAKSLGINVYSISIKPFRFDDARNAALALIPDDIDMCVSLDMDEVISEGWREELEKMTGNQITYVFNNDHAEYSFVNNRIHSRHGYRWKFLMHEGIVQDRTLPDIQFCNMIEVTHMPNRDKPRNQYLDLIKAALDENPTIARYYKYYTDALVSMERFEEAEEYYLKMLEIPGFSNSDSAHVYRILSKIVPEKFGEYMLRCLEEVPDRREPYYYIAKWYGEHDRWEDCLNWCERALEVENITVDIFKDNNAWGEPMIELYNKAKEKANK